MIITDFFGKLKITYDVQENRTTEYVTEMEIKTDLQGYRHNARTRVPNIMHGTLVQIPHL